MLFKALGYSSSFFNLAIIYTLFHNGVITDIGSTQWNIGIGSILLLSFFSTALFYLNDKEEGINILKLHSTIYAVLSTFVFSYYAVSNLISPLDFNTFKSFLMMFSALGLITFVINLSTNKKLNYRFLKILSNLLSVFTIGITFISIYKYLILQDSVQFDKLFIDLFMILIGSILFVGIHYYSENNK
jgi:hypothetical protein